MFLFQKKADKLEMTLTELSVWGVQEGKEYQCIMETKGTSNEIDFFICEIQMIPDAEFQMLKVPKTQSHSAPLHSTAV